MKRPERREQTRGPPDSLAKFVHRTALSMYGVDLSESTAEWIASTAMGFATRQRSNERAEAVALLRILFGRGG